MAGPPVYEDGLFELSIDPSYNSLDNTLCQKTDSAVKRIKRVQLSTCLHGTAQVAVLHRNVTSVGFPLWKKHLKTDRIRPSVKSAPDPNVLKEELIFIYNLFIHNYKNNYVCINWKSPRSQAIATFALCGFSNPASIGKINKILKI